MQLCKERGQQNKEAHWETKEKKKIKKKEWVVGC